MHFLKCFFRIINFIEKNFRCSKDILVSVSVSFFYNFKFQPLGSAVGILALGEEALEEFFLNNDNKLQNVPMLASCVVSYGINFLSFFLIVPFVIVSLK